MGDHVGILWCSNFFLPLLPFCPEKTKVTRCIPRPAYAEGLSQIWPQTRSWDRFSYLFTLPLLLLLERCAGNETCSINRYSIEWTVLKKSANSMVNWQSYSDRQSTGKKREVLGFSCCFALYQLEYIQTRCVSSLVVIALLVIALQRWSAVRVGYIPRLIIPRILNGWDWNLHTIAGNIYLSIS